MSYDEQIAKEEGQLNNNIATGMRVQETINTPGWLKTIKPLLDNMIQDILGRKLNNCWSLGCFAKDENLKNEKFFLGYRQGLIEFNNYVYKLVDQIKTCQDKLKSIDAGKKAGDVHPMVDGPYGKDKGEVPNGTS